VFAHPRTLTDMGVLLASLEMHYNTELFPHDLLISLTTSPIDQQISGARAPRRCCPSVLC
jgi:hypothetical protein